MPDDPSLSVVRWAIAQWAAEFVLDVLLVSSGRATNNWYPLVEIATSLGYGATARAIALRLHRHNIELEVVPP